MSTKSQPLTIAQCLRRAKSLEGKVAELARRLTDTTSWQKGREPQFNFQETLVAHDKAVAELGALRCAVARANANNNIVVNGNEIPITQGIHLQRELKGRIAMFAGFNLKRGIETVCEGYDERGRPVHSEIMYESVWSEPERAAALDELKAQLERLNEEIETTNHVTRVEVEV